MLLRLRLCSLSSPRPVQGNPARGRRTSCRALSEDDEAPPPAEAFDPNHAERVKESHEASASGGGGEEPDRARVQKGRLLRKAGAIHRQRGELVRRLKIIRPRLRGC